MAMQDIPTSYRLTDKGRFGSIALIVGVAGLVLTLVGFFVDKEQFFYSYHVAFTYCVTIALGMLFFTLLQHVTGAVWSIVVRRAAEAMSMTLPFLFLFFIPLLFGSHTLFHWSHSEAVAEDHLLQWKSGYLNLPFFVIRAVLYFGIWTALAFFLNKFSLAQDLDGKPSHQASMRKFSAGGMFFFAFSLTFAAFDWLMSMNPHWYSTMFGVYVFVGGFLASLTFMILFYQHLKGRGVLADVVTIDHYHDLGRLIFAFTVFWAYIGGSQYFMIWYANIPEETVWFLQRWEGGWKPVSMLLIFLHFGVPFITLTFYAMKRNPVVLRVIAALLLVMHYVDMYWLIMPTRGGVHFSWMDLTAVAGIGGIVLWLFYRRFAKHFLVPVNDPKLADSLAHRV
jgi:hypothetical protein